jgi:hypothetical protein
VLIVTHDDDCFNVQWDSRGWGAGDDSSGTNIVVMNEAIQANVGEAEDDLLEVLCHIPGVSQLPLRREGVAALAFAVTFTLQLLERNGGARLCERNEKRRLWDVWERECRQLGTVGFLQASYAGNDVAGRSFGERPLPRQQRQGLSKPHRPMGLFKLQGLN